MLVDAQLFVYDNNEVIVFVDKVGNFTLRLEDTTIEGLLRTFIKYNVIDISYPLQDVKQEALIKPIILKDIQDRIRRGLPV